MGFIVHQPLAKKISRHIATESDGLIYLIGKLCKVNIASSPDERANHRSLLPALGKAVKKIENRKDMEHEHQEAAPPGAERTGKKLLDLWCRAMHNEKFSS